MVDTYMVDSLYMPKHILQDVESLIWTTRFNDVGDFELVVPSTAKNRDLYKVGRMFTQSRSRSAIMIAEQVEDGYGDAGYGGVRRNIRIKGRSFERILHDRVLKHSTNVWGSTLNYNDSGTPAVVVRRMVQRMLLDSAFRLSPTDAPSGLVWGSVSDFTGAIPEPTETIRVNVKPGLLYDGVVPLCRAFQLGFRFFAWRENVGEIFPDLRFEVYTGWDRTTSQTVRKPVVFSEHFQNFSNVREYTSIEHSKNVAFVVAKNGWRSVPYSSAYPDGGGGIHRRVLFVDAGDIETASGSDLQAELLDRGRAALMEHQQIYAFDGEVSQTTGVADLGFELGDVVETQSPSGVKAPMRVSEMIYILDAEGERMYPTLSDNTYKPIQELTS